MLYLDQVWNYASIFCLNYFLFKANGHAGYSITSGSENSNLMSFLKIFTFTQPSPSSRYRLAINDK